MKNSSNIIKRKNKDKASDRIIAGLKETLEIVKENKPAKRVSIKTRRTSGSSKI